MHTPIHTPKTKTDKSPMSSYAVIDTFSPTNSKTRYQNLTMNTKKD